MTGIVDWIWQGLAVVVVTGLLVRLLPRLNAATRHVIWWIALVMVLVPAWAPSAVPVDAVLPQTPLTGAASDGPWFLPRPPFWVLAAAGITWLGAVAWGGWQIVRSIRVISALKQHSAPLDPARAQRLPLWRALSSSGRRSTLRVSDRAAGACALGFWRPMILVPRHLVDALSDSELDQVIAHEHAHLLRYDDWLRFVQCTVAATLGLHPAVWLIGRQLDLEREAACDDRVVARTGAARAYADCLARVATLLVAHQRNALDLVPAVTRSSLLLRSRVTRLLDRDWNRTQPVGWTSAVACLVALAVVVGAWTQMPPLVAFVDPIAELLPAEQETAAPTDQHLLAPTMPTLEATATSPSLRRGRGQNRTAAAPASQASPSLPLGASGASTAGTDQFGHPVTLDSEPVTIAAVQVRQADERPSAETGDKAQATGDGQPTQATFRATTAEATDPSWSEVGTNVARASVAAGTAVGTGAQRLGQAVGGWFAKAPWISKKPSP